MALTASIVHLVPDDPLCHARPMDLAVLEELYTCITTRWSPRIGDPTLMGWLTVVAYGAAAAASLAAGLARTKDRGFWLPLAVMLVLLGINKQLDLQSALTATGRCLAVMQGWYEQRRLYQFSFIVGLLIVCGGLFLFTLGRMRRSLPSIGVGLVGFGMLLTFVAVRAVGFHHFDAFIGTMVGPARMNWVMELGGLLLILANAITVSLIRREAPARGE